MCIPYICSIEIKTNKMNKAQFDNMRKEIQNDLYDWAVSEFGSWEEFKNFAFIEGKEFYLPTKLVPPATFQEWSEAKVNGGMTSGLIEVTDSWVRGFCVMDGHNRLKTLISEGAEEIKVVFRV